MILLRLTFIFSADMVLHHLLEKLNAKNIVLASSSPRRVEILGKNLGLVFRVIPSTFPEDLDKSLFTPSEYVEENALRKANEVFEKNADAELVIGCDTVVVRDDTILEKPQDVNHAFEMLKSLSGRSHHVYSGVALMFRTPAGADGSESYSTFSTTFHVKTEVQFANLSDEVIQAYIATGEPMDKAGGYGLQAKGASLVVGVSGCSYNVIGFPLHAFCEQLLTHLDKLNIQ